MADGDRTIPPDDTFHPTTDDIHDLSEFLPSISSSSSPSSGLDSISNQFKGILMDLHDSMLPTTPSPPDGDVKMQQEEIPGLGGDKEEDLGSALFTNSKLGANFDITSVATLPVHAPPPDAINDFTDDLEMGDASLNSFDNFASDISAAQVTETNEDNGSSAIESDEVVLLGNGDTNDIKLDEELLDLKPPSPGARIKLHVAKLPTGFKEEHIVNLFEPFGTVVECELFPYKNFAYVHLDNEAGGLEAIKMLNKIKLNGQNITVMKSKLATNVVPKAPPSSANEETVTTYKIYFSNLKPNVTKEIVTDLVKEYGRIVDIEIYRSNSAFVHMEEEEAGIRVIQELNGKVVPEFERPIDVSLSKNPEGPRIPVVRLQVKNLPEDLSANQIRSLFQPYGLVVSTTLAKSKFDPLRKAIVQLEQLGDIRSAIKDLGEMEFNGKKLLVEALLETPPIVSTPSGSSSAFNHSAASSSSSSKKKKKRGGGPNNFSPLRPPPIPPMLPPMRVMPERFADDGYHNYGDFPPPPPMFRGRGCGIGMRPPMFHRPPMMMHTERIARDRPPQPMLPPGLFGGGGPRGPRGGPFGGPRGGRGGGNGMPNMPPGGRPPFGPRFPKRPFQPHFPPPPEQYDFDTYYQDPSAASARDHYAPSLEDEYDSYAQQIQGNMRNFSSPPQKKSRGGGVGSRGGRGGGNSRPGNNIPTLMPSSFNPFAEDDDYLSTTQPPALQLSLGEREYFPPSRGRGGRGRGASSTIQQQRHATQQAQVESFQAKQLMTAAGYGPSSSQSNYLAQEQIPGSSFPPDDPSFQEDSYFDVPHTINGTFNAIPFDYSNLKRKPNGNQNVTKRGGGAPNQAGRGSGRGGNRGNRGGAGGASRGGVGGGKNKKKARHPGLGASKGGANQINPNEMPLGGGGGGGGFGPGAGTFSGGRGGGGRGAGSSNNFGGRGGGGRGGGNQTARYKTKQQAKDDNVEYAEFLANKSWLHQAIPGVVRPAQR